MKLWELNEKVCLEHVKMPNNIHKSIYVSLYNEYFNYNKIIYNQVF